MLEHQANINSLEEIRRYVVETLSTLELLKSDRCQLRVRLLTRGGEPCGMYFCLHGPRAVRLSAIWETESNSILFYGSTGERVQRTRLTAAPQLPVPPRNKLAG